MPVSLSEFADKITEVMPIIAKEFAKYHADGLIKKPITMPQLLVLNFLDTSGELKMKDLAKLMNVTTAAMTGVVDKLVRYGYADRIPDLNDRRIIRIKPTLKGVSLMRKCREQKRKMVIHIFGRMPERDREEYLRIILQVRDILINNKA